MNFSAHTTYRLVPIHGDVIVQFVGTTVKSINTTTKFKLYYNIITSGFYVRIFIYNAIKYKLYIGSSIYTYSLKRIS